MQKEAHFPLVVCFERPLQPRGASNLYKAEDAHLSFLLWCWALCMTGMRSTTVTPNPSTFTFAPQTALNQQGDGLTLVPEWHTWFGTCP